MPAKHLERQNRYVERLKAQGFKRYQLWLKPEEKDYIQEIIDIRRGIKEVLYKDIDTYTGQLTQSQIKLRQDIKFGVFTGTNTPQPKTYYHDFLTDPDLLWDKPLPNALLVLADQHKSVQKWRAVHLHGLGAFPIVWSIVYALKRYAYGKGALSKPRRRYFDLSVLPFEEIVQMIVGNAAMQADDTFKSTPFGFLTYRINATSTKVPSSIASEPPEGCLLVVIDHQGELLSTNAFCDNQEEITVWKLVPPMFDEQERKQGWNPIMVALTELFHAPHITL